MIEPNWSPKKRQLRQFAVISLLGFGLVGSVLVWRFGLETAGIVLWAIGATAFVAGLVAPITVYPLYSLLMLVTLPIGWAVSNLLLAILYFGIMTPFGLVLRATGRDPLGLKKPDSETYWRDREPRKDPASYYRQA